MKILIVSPIDSDAIKTLQANYDVTFAPNPPREELEALIADKEVLVFRSGVQINAALMEKAPNLRLLLRAGSGIDNLDLEYAESHGLQLIRIPEPGAKAVAEMTFAIFLALSRNLLEADRSMRNAEWAKYRLSGYLLTGKTLGVIGPGNIGGRVGALGAAWGMNVIAVDREYTDKVAEKLAAKGIRLTNMDEVLETSDFISIHVPLDDSTRHMINKDLLSKVKPGAYLVNIARGGIVDEAALMEVLQEGRLRGAGLDTHEKEGAGKRSPFADMDNVVLTPHIGAMTIDSQREIGERVIEACQEFALQKV
ncbi:hydroxyacid dehydrogenase [bacterium]|nr:hydroxyacid dehydrogenase [bacterium]